MQEIARIDPRNGKIELASQLLGLKFTCIRCAALCCRLGGIILSIEDIQVLRKILPRIRDFIVRTDGKYPGRFMLSSKPNGECIFLNRRDELYFCSIYSYRPNVCRLFPFSVSEDQGLIKIFVLPCRGLNNLTGDSIDEQFVFGLVETFVEDLWISLRGVSD